MDHPRQWGWREHFAAAQLHALQGANWQRAGKKGGPKPKPFPPPGEEAGQSQTLGTPVDVDEMRRILDEWSPPPDPAPDEEVSDGS